jgi:hypothetical protein
MGVSDLISFEESDECREDVFLPDVEDMIKKKNN